MSSSRRVKRGRRQWQIRGAAHGSVWQGVYLDERWLAVFRIAPDGGEPVVAELRIVPLPQTEAEEKWLANSLVDPAPRWSYYDAPPSKLDPLPRSQTPPKQGSSDDWWDEAYESEPAPVPPGGLTARALRGVHFEEALGSAYQTLEIQTRVAANTMRHGFTAESLEAPRRPGKKGRSDRFFAEVAAHYVAAVDRGSARPVKDVAQQMGPTYEPDYVRDVLHQARTRGLLTPPKRKGRAGGELTEKAHGVLAVEKEN